MQLVRNSQRQAIESTASVEIFKGSYNTKEWKLISSFLKSTGNKDSLYRLFLKFPCLQILVL